MRDDSIRNSSFKRHWKKLLRASNRAADVFAQRHVQYAKDAVTREFSEMSKYLKKLEAKFAVSQGDLFKSDPASVSPEALGGRGDYAERQLAEFAAYQMSQGNYDRVGFINSVAETIGHIKESHRLAMTAKFVSEGVSPKDMCLKNMNGALNQIDNRALAEKIVADINNSAGRSKAELDVDEHIGPR